MRSLLLPASALLLLTACGTQQAGSSSGASASSCPSDPSWAEEGGVRITGLRGAACDRVEFEVTNDGSEAFTYTVSFTFASESGAAMSSGEETVESVEPGRPVRRTVMMTGAERVSIAQVRSVPVDETPSAGGACPASGVRVYADQGDAAMGLRVVGLHLENCGTEPYRLNGYPEVEILDEEHEPIDSVRILKGGDAIAMGTGADAPPRPLTLAPGERAQSGLVWRNTTEFGEPVNAPYARIWAKPGAAPVTVIPELDLGTTGKLGVGAWQKEEQDQQPERPAS
ncbi:DUF4232 domain-containing protein [Streptomyces spinoverrucosus]|uniref:DUF4232 domain-containing protein n=1 Tax=Streptomyces spinoverrucosus TaxID=284043 RepID=UPI0018C38F63|nr:DUF4232 domain-containing protein [Streptomyces spinoverrucosus]MBG0851861.1 DUF4232 domain-containing protein [Streptomyces spinoverrucosus]